MNRTEKEKVFNTLTSDQIEALGIDNRYILFGVVKYYPCGGLSDVITEQPSIQKCLDYVVLNRCNDDHMYIYDRWSNEDLGSVNFQGEFELYGEDD